MGRPTNGYWVDGKRVPSVTTVLGNCKIGSIEGLLSWANKCGQDGQHHRDVANKAADAGSVAHLMCECWIKNEEPDLTPFEYEAIDTAQPCFEAFKEWAQQTNLEMVKSEVSLVSEKHRFGGTFDCLSTNGKLSLGDFKTSSGVFPEYLIQLSAYQALWQEANPDQPIEGGLYILRISKQKEPGDPISFHHHWWSNLDLAWEAFVHMRELYDMSKRLKSMC